MNPDASHLLSNENTQSREDGVNLNFFGLIQEMWGYKELKTSNKAHLTTL